MKSRLWCACVVMMLIVSPAAFAEIVTDGGWTVAPWSNGWGSGITSTTDTSSASVDVDGYGYVGNAAAQPWCSAHTTIRAICEWKFWVYAYSEARLFLSTAYQPCVAFAYVDAHASSSSSYSTFDPQSYQFVSYADETMFESSYEIVVLDGDENYDQDQAWFDPGEGVSADHTVQACAQVELTGYEEAYAHACARAKVSLRQTYP